MTQERRHFARVAFDAPAQLTTIDDRYEVKVLDLSLKGALLKVNQPLPLGEPCLLSLRLDGGESRIAMAAEIAHVDGDKAGLLCRSIDIESITHLRRLIEVNLGEASLLERELKALLSS
ncbi:PilZ domain-containing protein [Paucibacter sp. APW11]|uniref:Cyclic diguanosine monophosphate-binding protein n=1 Tax=Roseateles aquae TaxID=3077235 RepID=A0ABU3PDN2_9BURK|nr:PilZ domain-containing protein [Paucibacter sp. APW11]MDT9000685.1 PilZ domain-containing protein [Paucibacter sp. APW11]